MTTPKANKQHSATTDASEIFKAGQNLLWSLEMTMNGQPISDFARDAIANWKRISEADHA